jgi:hypothetical protein
LDLEIHFHAICSKTKQDSYVTGIFKTNSEQKIEGKQTLGLDQRRTGSATGSFFLDSALFFFCYIRFFSHSQSSSFVISIRTVDTGFGSAELE